MVNYLTRHNLIILLAGASVPAFYCIQVTKRSCCSITDFEPQLFCNSPFYFAFSVTVAVNINNLKRMIYENKETDVHHIIGFYDFDSCGLWI